MTIDLSALDSLQASFDERPARAPLDQFEEDPDQPRTEFPVDDAWRGLVADIRERGVIQPVTVRRVGAKLRLVYGARRYRASIEAGLADLPYVLAADPRQLGRYAQVAENEQRAGLSPLDLARFIASCVAAGDTKAKVAAELHISPTAVTFHLALLTLPPPLRDLYDSGRCTKPHLLYRLGSLFTHHGDRLVGLLSAADTIDRAFVTAAETALGGGSQSERADGPPAVPASAHAPAGQPTPGAVEASPAHSAPPSREPPATPASPDLIATLADLLDQVYTEQRLERPAAVEEALARARRQRRGRG